MSDTYPEPIHTCSYPSYAVTDSVTYDDPNAVTYPYPYAVGYTFTYRSGTVTHSRPCSICDAGEPGVVEAGGDRGPERDGPARSPAGDRPG